MNEYRKISIPQTVYKYMTNDKQKPVQLAEIHAAYREKKIKNVDILSVSYLIFAPE